VLVFADVIDDFVLVRYLSADAALLAIALGFGVYRRLTRGERARESTVEGFAAQL
jgi:hypothetical protein